MASDKQAKQDGDGHHTQANPRETNRPVEIRIREAADGGIGGGTYSVTVAA